MHDNPLFMEPVRRRNNECLKMAAADSLTINETVDSVGSKQQQERHAYIIRSNKIFFPQSLFYKMKCKFASKHNYPW